MPFITINAWEFNLNANKVSVKINKHQLEGRTKREGEQKKEGEVKLSPAFSSLLLIHF